MQELSFIGVSDDGGQIIVSLPDGRRFQLPIDERLRSATRMSPTTEGASSPTDQMRPREVQARLRSGATVDEVAELSGWPLDRVEAFGVPVLQERSFIAQRAAASLVRHGATERPLAEVVLHRLADRGVHDSELRWDAWRSPESGWTVLLAYPAAQGNRVATWSFDNESRTLISLDDAARWLTGEEAEFAVPAPTESQGPQAAEDAGADVVQIGGNRTRHAPEPGSSRHPAGRRQRTESQSQSVVEDTSSSGQNQSDEAPADKDSARSTTRPATRGTGKPGKRQPVPSWDDILFGGAPEDR